MQKYFSSLGWTYQNFFEVCKWRSKKGPMIPGQKMPFGKYGPKQGELNIEGGLVKKNKKKLASLALALNLQRSSSNSLVLQLQLSSFSPLALGLQLQVSCPRSLALALQPQLSRILFRILLVLKGALYRNTAMSHMWQ